jgi:hypothetical protein
MAINTNFPNVRPSLLLDFANSQQLDPRVTFTRSTNAPYYDGKTSVLAEQNLALQSQTFATGSWSTSNIAFTANSTIAPDGTSTATTITASGAGSLPHYSQSLVTTSAGIATDSIYVKTNTAQYVQIFFGGDATSYANFDVVNGTVTASSGTATGSIVSVGSGWYRCIASNTSTAVTGFGIAIIPASGSGRIAAFSAAGTESLYIWGGQVEQRSAVTAYNATTTTAITNYIPQLLTAPINAPRFDFNPTTGESLGLLIEQSSTNLLLQSQTISTSPWGKDAAAVITLGANIAPDGTQTMASITETTATSTGHTIYQLVSGLTNGISYTVSFYAKPNGRNFAVVQANTSSNLAYFNLSTGTVGTVVGGTATMTLVGNGVYRCTFTYTTSSTTGTYYFGPAIADNTAIYTGNGYSGIFLWGAQLEALAFPTSYIATTSAQVTRASDNASMTGTNFSSWYNIGQGTVYYEASSQALKSALAISDGTTNNRMSSDVATSNNLVVTTNGTVSPNISASGITQGVFAKVGLALQSGAFAVCVNGASPSLGNSGSIPNAVNRLYIGDGSLGTGSTLNGYIKKLAYYPIRVTNAQLQALTGT